MIFDERRRSHNSRDNNGSMQTKRGKTRERVAAEEGNSERSRDSQIILAEDSARWFVRLVDAVFLSSLSHFGSCMLNAHIKCIARVLECWLTNPIRNFEILGLRLINFLIEYWDSTFLRVSIWELRRKIACSFGIAASEFRGIFVRLLYSRYNVLLLW